MNSFSNLLSLDLSSYGSALAIINQFCDDVQVKVFEVSPIGTAGALALLIHDDVAAELLKNEIFSFYKADILAISLIKKMDLNILKTYLSQNSPLVFKNILVQEFSFISEGFSAADHLAKKQIQLLDFRVVRTFPMNVILISTAAEASLLFVAKTEVQARSSVVIENVEPVLKQYFQIIQNPI